MSSNLNNDRYATSEHVGVGESGLDNPDVDQRQSAGRVQRQIKAKPVSSVAIAVTAGIGAGLLLSTILGSERFRKERLARRLGSYLTGGGNLRSSLENLLPDSITDRYCD